ncbi:MAG TPA: carotenoid oxygenase family protein [Microthrixaceae bacterium]|nr:carotenoid oxygenase family protein [Microthrixaceae bacterium]
MATVRSAPVRAATTTRNLFWGTGPGDHALTVTDGHWPTDMEGRVFIVGPDKRRPGGHWFDQQGLLCRIELRPGSDGRIDVRHRRVDTPLSRIRSRLPFLFTTLSFMEISPFGLTNLANTNVQTIDDRLFVGYDAGRPLEVDPETMAVITPVGGNDEWYQASPGILEPGISVAAHPASDVDEGCLWFVNYSPLPLTPDTFVARWRLDGPVERWRLEGMTEFDSIHDVKVTRDHIVFTDLPFIVEPATFAGKPQTTPNRDWTSLWIVAKSDLEATPVGGSVRPLEIRIPMPTAHLSVDYEHPADRLTVYLEQIPIQDLMIRLRRGEYSHGTGAPNDPNFDGMVSLAPQPGVVGRYEIDLTAGEVVRSDLAWDDRFWGAVLATKDESSPAARAHQGQLWYSGIGFDPALVAQTWWDLYADAGLAAVVDPREVPMEPVPAGLARFDRESMKVAEVYRFDEGSFPHPPTFVPRTGATDPDDGYIVTVIHRDGPKEVWVFDASHLEAGPLARASAPEFNPPLLLHSCWMPPVPANRRRPDYRIPLWRDIRAAVTALPGLIVRIMRMGKRLHGLGHLR